MKINPNLGFKRMLATVLLFVFAATSAWPAVSVPLKGVTFGDWLTPAEATHVQSTLYLKADFEAVKSLGFDHVRIPVNFKTSSCVAPDYTVDPIFFKVLDQAVAWAAELELKIVIAEASDFTTASDPGFLAAVWKQIANHYKDRGDFLLFDVYPEHNLGIDLLNTLLAGLIPEITAVDDKHGIIVATANENPATLKDLPNQSGSNIVYAFRMTEPWIFTYQGGEMPSGYSLITTGIPFPYDAARMPAQAPGDASNTTILAWYNDYPNTGTVAYVQNVINSVATNNASRNGPLMCTTFGAPFDNIPAADRAAYITAVRAALESNNIAWTLGGFRGGWGLFDQDSEELMPLDVTNNIMTALGLTPPTKPTQQIIPLEEGFTIYDDAAAAGIRANWWLGDIGEPNYWVTDNAKDGAYCLGMLWPGQYNAINFAWHPIRDMLGLVNGGYALDLWFRCDNELADIDLRFEDSNIDFEDHPWRMNKRLSNSVVPFDGEWQHVQIPLSEFEDMGAWDPDDQIWYNGGLGLFDWTMVQTFQLVSETQVQLESELYFDNIRVVNPTAVKDRSITAASFALSANYPNPFNPSTEIRYAVPSAGRVTLSVYNLKGEKVRTLTDGTVPAGNHKAVWDGLDSNGAAVSSGVYVYRLEAGGQTSSRRMALMR